MAINVNKAKILREIVYSDSPVTYQLLFNAFGDEMGYSVIWQNLQRLILEGCIEEKNFRKEGIDAQDYRVTENIRGHVPKVYYAETQRGVDKFNYFKEKGIF